MSPPGAPRSQASIPVSALMLGLAGLIPFYALAIWQGITSDELLAERLTTAFVLYAATILSFLGGIGWGLAMSETDPAQRGLAFGVSVAPSLIAWAAAFINVQNLAFSLAILAVAFALQGAWDWRLARVGQAPRWFGWLRLGLTLAVLGAMAIAWFTQPELAGAGAAI
jgi:hypothetical protein